MTFAIGKMKLVSSSLLLMLPPTRPKMPLGQRYVAINIYNICKRHFGSGGEPNLGVASLIPARFHTFVEIDHEIISTVILLPSAESFKKGCCQLQAKVCAQSTG